MWLCEGEVRGWKRLDPQCSLQVESDPMLVSHALKKIIVHEYLLSPTVRKIKPLNFTTNLVTVIRTARRIMSSARVSVQSNSELRMTEACRQCCLCSLSSAPLPRDPSGLMVRASG